MAQAMLQEAVADADRILDVATELRARGWRLGTIVAAVHAGSLVLRYCFYSAEGSNWRIVQVRPGARSDVPSLTPVIIAADFLEREIQDVFSVRFLDHPRPGDMVFHEDSRLPRLVLNEEGAFVMPVGPIFSGEAESALFLLETVGEDVVRSVPRLFYKYRAIEKLAEGRSLEDALLLVERCNGTNAIGNAWSYTRAIEGTCGAEIPARAQVLRAFFAELERIRHHVTGIREICNSTALIVGTSQILAIEEELLRISGALAGHRYLFGVLAIGGMMQDFEDEALLRTAQRVGELSNQLRSAHRALAETSSFLDRIERVGIISNDQAQTFELLGPVARASGVSDDMRKIQPYGPYASLDFEVPLESEGDGYARLRQLFTEVEQSVRVLGQLTRNVPRGAVRTKVSPVDGSGLGWTEASRGAAIAWVQTNAHGTIARLRLTPPSVRNWHGFHIATERFSFQDFPIILATLYLSVAENDR